MMTKSEMIAVVKVLRNALPSAGAFNIEATDGSGVSFIVDVKDVVILANQVIEEISKEDK